MSLQLAGPAATEAIARLKGSAPGTHVLVLAPAAAELDAVDVVRMGGSCYLLKDAPVETILAGVRAAAAGEALISPKAAAVLVRHLRADAPGDGPAPAAVLSNRVQAAVRAVREAMA